MTTWIVEPRDPLIFRDGRPFGNTPGARARSLSFPLPATTSGAVRTRAGSDSSGVFDTELIAHVRTLGIGGPWLVELDESGEIRQWLVPAPADAVPLQGLSEEDVNLRRLVPIRAPTDLQHNLPDGLQLVGMPTPDPAKPVRRPPAYWRWEMMQQWLFGPSDNTVRRDAIGVDGPITESRTHVAVAEDTSTAIEGALFQTSGREFTGGDRERFAIAMETSAELTPGPGYVGGERRLAFWRKSDLRPPSCPAEIIDAIVADSACRITLVSPACFDAGYRPPVHMDFAGGVKAELRGAAVPRATVVSGWDYEKRRAKPTRRLAPAGSTYFLTLDGKTDALRRWVSNMWLASVSDKQQDRLDGFGMVVLGTWSGQLAGMGV